MNETEEKYLAQMLEGVESNLPQVDMAIEQVKAQLEKLEEQLESMNEASMELRELLGLEDEENQPPLTLVSEDS